MIVVDGFLFLDHGIDVTVLQSGPMATRFQDNLPKLDAFKFYSTIDFSHFEFNRSHLSRLFDKLMTCLYRFLYTLLHTTDGHVPLDLIQSTPDSVARLLINSVGRIVIRDASLYTVLARLFVHALDLNVQFPVIYWGQFLSTDYRKFKHLLY